MNWGKQGEKHVSRPRHAATFPVKAIWKRFITWTDQPMTAATSILCGAFMGIVTGPVIFFCYFGHWKMFP